MIRQPQHLPRKTLRPLLLLAMACATAAHAVPLVDGNKRLQLGRYTTAEAVPQPNLADPLALVAQITFPREQVSTVGEAIDYTLLRTGYALVDAQALTQEARRFLGLPLPEAQRTLGPYSVQDMLNVLVGKAWAWHTDHVTRRLWLTLVNGAAAPVRRQLAPIVSPAKAKE